jgi:CDK-activating kinase assembly factor MAT1
MKGRGRAIQAATIPDVPHVPLQDDWYAYEDKVTLRNDYDDPISDAVRRDREGIMRAGGYFVEQAWERALRSAVAGLEIFPLKGLHATTSSMPDVTPPSQDGDVVMTPA